MTRIIRNEEPSSRRLMKWITISLLLLFLWFILNVFYIINSEQSPSILTIHHAKDNFYNFTEAKLTKAEKIGGRIKAEENYLGILSIRFAPSEDIVSDKIIFRLKEKDSSKWYYENIYDARQFYFLPLYTFGFPIIENSKDKIYEFEIQSLKGTRYNSVNLSREEPTIISKYKFPKQLLLTNPAVLHNFIVKKSNTALKNKEFLYPTAFFLLPLLLYFTWHLYIKFHAPERFLYFSNYLKFESFPLLKFIFIIVFIDIFLLNKNYNFLLVLVLILWIIAMERYKIPHRASFLFSLALVTLHVLLLIFRMDTYGERAAIWSYMFLSAGTLQWLIHLKLIKKKGLTNLG